MRVTSKIKTIFNDDLLRYTAAICDTKRIESNADKMIASGNLLYTHGVEFEILGGATNRLALQIEGYAVKLAMDEQGYMDNLIEYSLSPELQPYATKTYETNGYILIAECVEVINTAERFEFFRNEIRKILDTLCQDYLLGDVGYIKKNMTNWGVRDNHPVILDYAYCHRATENLFTCSRCGSALKYDASYDVLLCSDREGCKARYTYNERKRIQGKEVDINMIRERMAESIRLSKGVKSKEIELFEDRLVGDNYFIIDNPGDLHRYEKMKEEREMRFDMNGNDTNSMEDRLAAMIALAKNPSDEEAKNVILQNLSEEDAVPEPVYTDNYQENYMYGRNLPMRVYSGISNPENPEVCDETDSENFDMEGGLAAMISRARKAQEDADRKYEEDKRSQEEKYFESLQKRSQQGVTVSRQGETPAAAPQQVAEEHPEDCDCEICDEGDNRDPEDCALCGQQHVGECEHPQGDDAGDYAPVEEDEVDGEEYEEGDDGEETEVAPVELPNTEKGEIFLNGKPLEIGEEVTVRESEDGE